MDQDRGRLRILENYLHTVSPVHVRYVSRHRPYFNYVRQDLKLGDDKAGTYHHDEVILIGPAPTFVAGVNTLAHEVGHAICYETKCRCYDYRVSEHIREAHAILYTLYIAVDWNIVSLIKQALDKVHAFLKYSEDNKYYLAAQQVIDTSRYKTLMEV